MALEEDLVSLAGMDSRVCKVRKVNLEKPGYHPPTQDQREKGDFLVIQVVVDSQAQRDQQDPEDHQEGLAPRDLREILDHLVWMD